MPKGDLPGRLELRLLGPFAAWMDRSGESLFLPCVEWSGKVPGREARTGDEDVDKAPGAGLPAWYSSGVEDADEGTDKVVGVGIGAEITTVDGAPDGGYEGGVDKRAGAFEEAHGAAGDGVQSGNDELFGGEVVDKEQHPGAEGFERRHGSGKPLLSGGEFFNFVAVDGFDEVVASWEVAIEGGVADAGSACDVVEARSSAIVGEDVLGYLKDALAVALRVGARSAGRRGW
jgi:hypothetical protein